MATRPSLFEPLGLPQLAYNERARDDGFAGNAMLVVVLPSLGCGEDLRIRMGPSGLARQSMLDDRDRGRAPLFFLYTEEARQNAEVRSSRPGTRQSALEFTMYQVVIMWLMANEYVPTINLTSNPILFVAGLVLLPIWSAFHFYWMHRLLHVPFIYKHVHSLHHRNVNIGPWSGLSMHPVEHLLYLSSLLIHFVFPSHPILVYFHVIYLGPGAAMTHTGYEDLLVRDKRRLALGTFYHQLHHRYYECNYGNQEMPWDRWFGTFHDGSDDGTQATRTRKKTMHRNI